jgi:hypothetical protein
MSENKALKVENERLPTLLGRIEHVLGPESIGQRRQARAPDAETPVATPRGRSTARVKAKARRAVAW